MKISIVIATYNADLTLGGCLNSIIPQLTGESELIVIDGGSSDSTLEIIMKYKDHISYSISERDNGIYDAWNKGIKASRGEWIMFVGADDFLLPDALSAYNSLLNSIDLSGYDYISAHNEFVDNSGRLIKILGKGASWNLMRMQNSAAHVASLHNVNIFKDVGNYNLDYPICADYELLVRKKDKLKSYFFNKTIAVMKVGGVSFSTKAIKEVYQIRKVHNTINQPLNFILYLRDYLAFYLFRVRKSV